MTDASNSNNTMTVNSPPSAHEDQEDGIGRMACADNQATRAALSSTDDSDVVAENRSRNWLQVLYLTLAAAGGILPWLANLAFIRENGASFDLGLFISLASANPAAQSLSFDLAIGATSIVVWMIVESRRLQMRGLSWVLLSCATIAFAFGAPLFLYLRERRLSELSK